MFTQTGELCPPAAIDLMVWMYDRFVSTGRRSNFRFLLKKRGCECGGPTNEFTPGKPIRRLLFLRRKRLLPFHPFVPPGFTDEAPVRKIGKAKRACTLLALSILIAPKCVLLTFSYDDSYEDVSYACESPSYDAYVSSRLA